MKRQLLAVPAVALLVAACGGGTVPAASPARESGQSALMDQTFAGKNKCSAKNHERPFVIEWDATDMSSFESKAASDVVIVKYEGCNLEILDRCSIDSIKGANGAYGAPEWTSGSVEKIDIKNEGELYAKLPLGAASLGGRVQGGEQFHMEYFVSGTKKSTRADVYRKDIEKIPGCKGATHFVYAYNLGAFALGSAKDVKAEAGGTVWGIGAGGKTQSLNSAEKKGGVLTACRGETAKESQTCMVPIRLQLREISEEENPDAVATRAPETPDAMNLAGKVNAKLQMNAEAQSRYQAAMERYQARDGKGCLKELDARDKADPSPGMISTNPKSVISMLRGQCVMLSGQCDAGKQQLKRAYTSQLSNQMGPEQIDTFIDSMAAQHCQGGSMTPRDQLLQAYDTLQKGSMTRKDAATCNTAYATVKRLSQTVKPRDEDDNMVKIAVSGHSTPTMAAICLGRAGDCASSFKAYEDSMKALYGDSFPSISAHMNMRDSFERTVPSCKGK